MPSVNVDMLKQLLDDFQEKEALAAEAVNNHQQQIQELEARIGSCRERLNVVAADRERVLAIMQRWVAGTAAAEPSVPTALAPTPSKARDIFGGPVKAAGGGGKAAKAAAAKIQDVPEVKAEPISEPSPAPLPAEAPIALTDSDEAVQPAEEIAEAQPESVAKEESGDTVKSINDALRGLFS